MLSSTPSSTRSFTVASLSFVSLAAVILVGCKDPKVAQAAKFEAEFNAVAASYASTVASNTNLLSIAPSADSLNALRAIAEQAKGLSGGTPPQQEAAAQLATSIHRTAGTIELAHALRLEASEELGRNFVLNASDLANGLNSIAEASENLDFSSARRKPQAEKDAAALAARSVQEAIASIERPLGQLVTSIANDTARVDQLELESALLLRKSRESSPAAGLAFVEEAAAIEAEARAKRTALAGNDLTAIELDSQLKLVKASLTAAEGLQTAATSALEFVANYEGDIDGAASKSRALATQLQSEATALLKTISEERATALTAAYEAAAGDFSNASAGLGSDSAANALRYALLCDELRASNARVHGLGSHGRMLATLGSSSAAELAQVKTAADSAITSLKEKCASANDAMAAIGEDPAYLDLKTYITNLKKNADALSVDALLAVPVAVVEAAKPATKPAATSGRSRAGSSASSSAGIEDPEAFVAHLATLDPSAAVDALLDAVDDSTVSGKALKDIMRQTMAAMKPAMDAITEKFGAAGVAALKGGAGAAGGAGGAGGMMGGMDPASMTKLTKQSNDGSRAVFKAADGSDVVFVKGASGWKIDMTAAMADKGMSEEQFAQMAPMMSMMMAPMIKAMKTASEDVAAKIRSGEIKTAEEAGAAMSAAMMAGMAGALGGLGAGLEGLAPPK